MASGYEQHSIPISKRTFDAGLGLHVVKLFSGDTYVSRGNEMLVTILGSCVAACIRDPIANIGGMNHFLLPGDGNVDSKTSESTRYGVFAMETLINNILKEGGKKERLEIKVFGGGNVIKSSTNIGSKNAIFIRGFLKAEGYQILSEDLEGKSPRRIHYFPDTGKVMVRKLNIKDDVAIVREEETYRNKINSKPVEGDIDLF